MYKLSITLLLCFCIKTGFGQQLIFSNENKKKEIKAEVGTMLFVTYNGYNGQHEFASQIVTDMTDSTVTLGMNPYNIFGKKHYTASANNYKVIYLKDITAFRKRTVGGVLLQAVVNAGGLVGSVFLLNDLYRNSNISVGNAFLISVGAGLAIRFGTMLIFPANAKHKMSDGWKVRVSGLD